MLPRAHGPARRPWRNPVPPMFLYQPPPPMLLYPPTPYGAAIGPPSPYAAVPYFGHPMPPAAAHTVQLQSVAAANFAAELDRIGSLLPRYPYVVVDTEYPGTVHHAPAGRRDSDLSPDERYALVKANVDELPIVQLGITLCDSHGNLPFVPDYRYGAFGYHHGGGGGGYGERAWEVDFSDFDVSRDHHAAQSVAFLRSQGVDFDTAARARGVSSAAFGAKLAEVLQRVAGKNVELTWVAFGGAYDLAYLVKMIGGGQPLPETRQGFVERVRELLGGRVFDAKFMAENCGRADLRGVGLRSVAANLGAAMPAAADMQPWLAGTKSVTAYRIHTILRLHVLSQDAVAGFEGIIDGLQ
ncbi:probable CCR4-associated factor 1 homolog 9 [Miscanthus floridulus]|uniref:probable CCR4-associated factor 1 homolog 9 n=1 Tax=Miscanthus floridulus TaxID=154761 RepID=UPI003459F559